MIISMPVIQQHGGNRVLEVACAIVDVFLLDNSPAKVDVPSTILSEINRLLRVAADVKESTGAETCSSVLSANLFDAAENSVMQRLLNCNATNVGEDAASSMGVNIEDEEI